MTVDIIIPTYKPDETLCLLLHKLQGQTFVVHRVIILNTEEKGIAIHGSSVDQAKDVLERWIQK